MNTLINPFWNKGVGVGLGLHALAIVLVGLIGRASPTPAKPDPPVTMIDLPTLVAAPKPPIAAPKPIDPVKPRPQAKPTPQHPIPISQSELPRSPTPTTDSSPVEPTSNAPETTAQTPTTPPAPAEQSTTLAPNWQSLLMAHLDKVKHYPASARDRGQQGIVIVSISLSRTGDVLSSSIHKGSGVAVLDQEALTMMARASPLPAPPADVAGDPVELVIPVRFSVRDHS